MTSYEGPIRGLLVEKPPVAYFGSRSPSKLGLVLRIIERLNLGHNCRVSAHATFFNKQRDSGNRDRH